MYDSPAQEVDGLTKNIRSVLTEVSEKQWVLGKRLRWLKALDDLIVLRKNEILQIVARDRHCNEHNVLLNEYAVARSLIKECGKIAQETLGDENRSKPFSLNWANKKVVVQKVPLGIVGIISPYNYPFSLPMGAVISAILAGNGVILKPAEETEATNGLINALMCASLAPFGMSGIFQILPGSVEHGKELVKNSFVDKIHFTGSVRGGLSVLQENFKVRLVPPTLELGGSNAAIVLDDANIQNAAQVIVWGRFASMSCNNIKRVFAVEEIYNQLCQEIERQLEHATADEVGPIPAKEIVNYAKFIADYSREYPETELDETIRPRILKIWNPDSDALVLTEETFVPLLPIVKVQNEAEAIRLANKSQFGLGASVFTGDKTRFEKIAQELLCGGVYHNDAMTEFCQPQIPFGGWKQSGYGYTHGKEGLLEFVKLRTVITERWGAPKPQLFPWTAKKMKFLRMFIDWIVKFS